MTSVSRLSCDFSEFVELRYHPDRRLNPVTYSMWLAGLRYYWRRDLPPTIEFALDSDTHDLLDAWDARAPRPAFANHCRLLIQRRNGKVSVSIVRINTEDKS